MKQRPYTLYLPDDLVKDIEEYQRENYISTRNATILQLITRSLNHQHRNEREVNRNGQELLERTE